MTNGNDYLEKLNTAQRAAVEYLGGPQLVIAGAIRQNQSTNIQDSAPACSRMRCRKNSRAHFHQQGRK